jgi:hypothetical protein
MHRRSRWVALCRMSPRLVREVRIVLTSLSWGQPSFSEYWVVSYKGTENATEAYNIAQAA